MADIIQCDTCGEQGDRSDETREEWNVLTLSKHITPSAPFLRMDMCKGCSDAVRSVMARLSNKTTEGEG